MRTDIRDSRNLIIGFVNDIGSEVIATHLRKGYAGRYVKSSNITLDKSGKIYCYGDGTSSLIRDLERENN